MLAIIQQAALLLGTATGAVTDAKTGYIYDWITYPMIIAGVILAAIQQQWLNIEIGAGVFALLYIAYKLGKLGGGDVKIISAIAILNPTNEPMFLVSAIFFAAIGAIIFYSIYYTIKYLRKGISFEENKKGIGRAIVFGIIIAAYFAALTQMHMLSTASAILVATPLMFGLLFIGLQEGIRKNFFEAKIAVAKLEEDEVIAEGANSEKIAKLLKGKQLIGKKEAALLKKAGIKNVIVLRKLPPFGPFILLGIIMAMLMPEFLMFLFI